MIAEIQLTKNSVGGSRSVAPHRTGVWRAVEAARRAPCYISSGVSGVSVRIGYAAVIERRTLKAC